MRLESCCFRTGFEMTVPVLGTLGLTEFAHGWYFLYLLIVAALVVAYVAVQITRRRRVLRFANMDLLQRIAPAGRVNRWRHVPAVLTVVALVVLTIALAGPTDNVRIPRNRAVVMLVIDVSESMLATDVAPSRLEAAKEAGGMVIGLSPAASKLAHVKTYHLPVDFHDLIIYTGFDYSGRNLLLTRSADAIITIYGRIGTLNEFTIAFEDKKPQGVLTGTGGESDELQHILEIAHRGNGKVVFDPDPKSLMEKVFEMIKADEKEVKPHDVRIADHRARG